MANATRSSRALARCQSTIPRSHFRSRSGNEAKSIVICFLFGFPPSDFIYFFLTFHFWNQRLIDRTGQKLKRLSRLCLNNFLILWKFSSRIDKIKTCRKGIRISSFLSWNLIYSGYSYPFCYTHTHTRPASTSRSYFYSGFNSISEWRIKVRKIGEFPTIRSTYNINAWFFITLYHWNEIEWRNNRAHRSFLYPGRKNSSHCNGLMKCAIALDRSAVPLY